MPKTKPSDEALYLEAAENGDVQKMKNLLSKEHFYHTCRSESEDKFQWNVMHRAALNAAYLTISN